jgi:hypothetical protein
VALDQDDARAHARGLQRRREPARTRADHHDIRLAGDGDGSPGEDYGGGQRASRVLRSGGHADLVHWSAEPPLLTRVNFGTKHRGERFDAVPEDYLRWIVEGRNELREEIKASAAYWLQKRAATAPAS